jgi:hypothetical protein
MIGFAGIVFMHIAYITARRMPLFATRRASARLANSLIVPAVAKLGGKVRHLKTSVHPNAKCNSR